MMGAPIFLPGLFTFHLKEGVNNFERWFWLVTIYSLFFQQNEDCTASWHTGDGWITNDDYDDNAAQRT